MDDLKTFPLKLCFSLLVVLISRMLKRGICPSHHFAISYGGEFLYSWILLFLGLANNFFLRVMPPSHDLNHACNVITWNAQQLKCAPFTQNNPEVQQSLAMRDCQNGVHSLTGQHCVIKRHDSPLFNFPGLYVLWLSEGLHTHPHLYTQPISSCSHYTVTG